MSPAMGEPDGKRQLTTLDATLLVMGGIVGVGIFFTPQEVARQAPAAAAFLALWVFGGAIALCAAFTFAELGATFPRSGGWFVFLREAFGPFPAFLFAWVVLAVISTGAIAAIVGFCAAQLHAVFPAWIGPGPVAGDPAAGIAAAPASASHRAVAIGIIVLLTAITMAGVKRAALLQNACMILKLVAIAGLIVGGLVFVTPTGGAGGALAAPGAAPADRPLAAGMVSALKPVFFSYGGWQLLCYIAPEVRDAARTLPRAIVAGVLGVLAIYLFANVAYLRGLGIDGIRAEPTFAATLAGRAFGATGERLLAAGMAISALGVAAVNVITGPWLYVAMAREGLFFGAVGRLSARTGAPVVALCIQGALAVVYFFASTLQELVSSVVFVEWIFHGLAALALLRLRAARPSLPRPFRSFAYPLAPLVYLVASLLVVGGTLWADPWSVIGQALAVVAVGIVVYWPWRRLVARAGRI
ncbi:MAG: amino acid permease [Planctomycetota bacterium]